MNHKIVAPKRITEDDPPTLDEEYEIQRIASLPPRQQEMAIESLINRFNATPSYVETNAAQFANQNTTTL